MVCDLDYFYEKDLDRKNLKDFYHSLPSHLQKKFEACLHAEIHYGNTLQGYRGPSRMCNKGSGDSGTLNPSHGLQKIRFWWGSRKDDQWVPVFGTLWYTLERSRQKFSGELEWSSLYFDSHTGECLGHNRREAARILKSRAKKAKSQQSARSSNNDSDDDDERDARASEARSSTDDSDDGDDYERRARRNAHRQRSRREESYTVRPSYGPEDEALDLYLHEKDLFSDGRYGEAADAFERAFHTSQVDRHRAVCHEAWMAARAEKRAQELNLEGDELLESGQCTQAQNRYQEAFNTSKLIGPRQTYEKNVGKAQVEIDAQKLNSEGTRLFRLGRFGEAQSKYREACDNSKVWNLRRLYEENGNKAFAESLAAHHNTQGDKSFSEGKFSDALSKYQAAHNNSNDNARIAIYKANIAKAQAEIDAINSNNEGDNLFNQGRFQDALRNYQAAHNNSKVTAQIQKFKANADKAQAEIDAINSNNEGDNLFNQGRFQDALRNYQAAHNTSKVTAQIQKFKANADKAQDIINRLNMLDTLWEQAWDTENDTKLDRSEEAKQLFESILSESERNLITFSCVPKFKQYQSLALLKIEGNRLFNEGLASQKNGMAFFQEAQKLKQQEKYESANEKFKEANKYLQKALEKFEAGSRSDQRFVPCVEFVQQQIDEVTQSIEITEQRMLSARLQTLDIGIGNSNHTDPHTSETGATVKEKIYSHHI